MPEVTKGEMDMIFSVADTGIAEVNESGFLRRSGRLAKTQAAPTADTPLSKEDTIQATIMPNPARRIAAMKSKVTTMAGRKVSATVNLSTGTKTLIITGLTREDVLMDDAPKFSDATATKATNVVNSIGRNASVARQNPAVTQNNQSAASDEEITHSNTDDFADEMSSAIDDTHDSDFVPEVTLSDNVVPGLLSHPALGGALPASPPASDDASSQSKKRNTDSSDSEIGSPKKRSKSGKNTVGAKASDDKQLTIRSKGPSPHGKPLVWAEVSFYHLSILLVAAKSLPRVAKHSVRHSTIIALTRAEGIL